MFNDNKKDTRTMSENVYFANIEQALLGFFIAYAKHNLIKLKLYNN